MGGPHEGVPFAQPCGSRCYASFHVYRHRADEFLSDMRSSHPNVPPDQYEVRPARLVVGEVSLCLRKEIELAKELQAVKAECDALRTRLASAESILDAYDEQWTCTPERIFFVNRAASLAYEAHRAVYPRAEVKKEPKP